MKKLLAALSLILPLSVANADQSGYYCHGYTPETVCDYDGNLQEAFADEMTQLGYELIGETQWDEVLPDYLAKRRYIQFNFEDPIEGVYANAECSAFCSYVLNCPTGFLPDEDEYCIEPHAGPFKGGVWRGYEGVDPATGEPTQAMIDEFYSRHGRTLRADDPRYSIQVRETYLNEWKEVAFVRPGSAPWVYIANKPWWLTSDGKCPDNQYLGEYGKCGPANLPKASDQIDPGLL